MSRLIKSKPYTFLSRAGRIYSFPNSFGLLGFALFLVIVTVGATYQNNLIFTFGFVLFSLGAVAILKTARHLQAIKVVALKVVPSYSDTPTEAELIVKNDSAVDKFQVSVRVDGLGSPLKFKIEALKAKTDTRVKIPHFLDSERGVHTPWRARLETESPYGLIRAWNYQLLSDEVIVYPKPKGAQELEAEVPTPGQEFSEHRPYLSGESMNRVNWKIFGRTQKMYVKEFHGAIEGHRRLAWHEIKSGDFESKLSQMSQWIRLAHESDEHFDVELPGFHSGVGKGSQHFKQCMEALTRMAS